MTKQIIADWAESGLNRKRNYIWLRMYHDEGITTLKMTMEEAKELVGDLTNEINTLSKES